MEKVIVAFEAEKSCQRVREILESTGTAACIVCRSAAEVRRAAGKQPVAAVVCGYKFPDGSAEALFADLPPGCAMLLIAVGSLLELVDNGDIFKLPAPVTRGALTAAVGILLQAGRRPEGWGRPRRDGAEAAVVRRAKEALMARRGMSEEEAHRFLQKMSMDGGARLSDTARRVLGEG